MNRWILLKIEVRDNCPEFLKPEVTAQGWDV